MRYIGHNNTVFIFTTSDLFDFQQRESELLTKYGFDPKEWQLAFDDDIRGSQ